MIPNKKGIETTILHEGWFDVLAHRKRELLDQLGKNGKKNRLIAVFGGAKVKDDSARWKRAYRLGAQLANRGGIIFNGGYGGVMESSAAGAKSVGGITVGVSCKNLPVDKVNKFIDHEWDLNRWDQRLLALVWLADGYVVMTGGSGTLVELSVVIETQLKGFIPTRPIVCAGSHWKPVVKRIEGTEGMVYFEREPSLVAEIVMSK